MRTTNRSQILAISKKYGFITKRMAATKHLSYGLGDHIMHLRKTHIYETIMMKNKRTGSRFAIYKFKGEKK